MRKTFPRTSDGVMKFELLEGEEWRGDYPMRRAAMSHAELIAAKRGQAITWVKASETATVGTPHPGEELAVFTVRLLPGVRWMRRA
jgi:hypothetical protein